MRSAARLRFLFLGLVLIAAGQCVVAHPEFAAGAVGRLLHSEPMALLLGVFPRTTALGLACVVIGAFVVAAAIGLPAVDSLEDGSATHRLARWLTPVTSVLLVVAGVFTFLCGYSLRQPQPGQWSVITWVGALLTMLIATVVADRHRGTRFGNPLPARWEGVLAVLLVAGELILLGHDLTHWAWSGVPDEAHFFAAAQGFARGELKRFLLSEEGVFGYHPVLSSYYQVLFMKMFGVNIFAWRLSSAAALAISLPAVYLLGRELCSRRAGYIAAVLLGSAPLAVSYAHWGYNNAQVYPVLTGSLAVLAWSVRRRTLAGYYLSGCLAGLGFYTFYPARLALVLVVILVWGLGAVSVRRNRVELGALMAGALITIVPVLARRGEALEHMLRQTAFSGPEQHSATQIFAHWLESVLYASWIHCSGNFGWDPVVDPITAGLAIVGLWLGVFALIRRHRIRFFFPAYVASAFVLGAISQYTCPPLTRLLALAPFTALLAAVALDQLIRRVAGITAPRRLFEIVGVACAAAAVIWNIAMVHTIFYTRHHGFGDGTTSELIRLSLDLPSDYTIVFIQRGDNSMYDVDMILAEYGLARSVCIRPFNSGRVESRLATLTPPFAIFYDLTNPAEAQAVEALLARRFPESQWRDSDRGRRWNLRYVRVPDGVTGR